MVPLLPHHRLHLHESGLSDQTIAAAQVASCVDPAEAAEMLNWDSDAGPAPAIVFPLFTVDGEQQGFVLRPDVPWRRADGSEPKYEVAKGLPPRPYVLPAGLVDPDRYLDNNVPLIVTEGIKKGLAVAQATRDDSVLCPVVVHGVAMVHDIVHRQARDAWRLHPDISRLIRAGRPVFLAFDGGDTSENHDVIMAEARAARMLLDQGASVRLIRVPSTPGGPKVGIDDYLVTQADPAVALIDLRQAALLANPFERVARVVGISGQERRNTEAMALLNDPSFCAALNCAGRMIVDLVAASLKPLGINRRSIDETLKRFDDAFRETNQGPNPTPAFTPEEIGEAEVLLRDPRMIDRFLRGIAAEGVVGEQGAAHALLLVTITRKTRRPIHAVVKAASASGKNYVLLKVLARLPKGDVVLLTDLSPRSLLFQTSSMRGKVFAITEHEGAERAEYLMRVAMSEGSLSVLVAEKSEGTGAIQSRQHEVDGPACFITTTTRASLHDENETRVLEIPLDETEGQTQRIVRAQADRAASPPSSEEIERQEHELRIWQCALGLLDLTETITPGAHELLCQFPTRHIRARRDFARVLDVASANALLHQRQRQVIDGRVVVEETDIRIARELCDPLYQNAAPRLQSIAERLRAAFGQAEFTTAEAATSLGYNQDAIRRNLQDLEGHDLVLKVTESRGSKAAKWKMPPVAPLRPPSGPVSPLPTRTSGSPTPTDIPGGRTLTPGGSMGLGLSDCPTPTGTTPSGLVPSSSGGAIAENQVSSSRTVGLPQTPSPANELRPTEPEVGRSRTVRPAGEGVLLPTEGPLVFHDPESDGGAP